jgi:plasmid stabilization system protein ParE
MSYDIRFLTRAAADYERSAQWYDEQQEGLGEKFIAEVKNKIKFIANNPEIYPKLILTSQQATLNTFPFVVVFRIDKVKNVLFILSIFHTSRNPKQKLRRKF